MIEIFNELIYSILNVFDIVGIANPVPATTTINGLDNQTIISSFFFHCQLLAFHCQLDLMSSKEKAKYYPYRLARLVHYDYSRTKDWYINWDEVTAISLIKSIN